MGMTNEEREKEIRKQPAPTKEECIAFYKELTKLADVRFVPYYKMAIKALEQQPCEDWYDVPSDEMTLEQARQAVKDLRKKLAEYLEQQTSEDCISRDAVKEMLSEEWTKYMPMDLDINLSFVMGKINELPSVTPKARWIPVSKRLPEPQKDGNKDFSEWVLVTLHIRKNDDVVGRAYYCFSDKTWYAERFGSGKVVAWMPQPEPYKESEE